MTFRSLLLAIGLWTAAAACAKSPAPGGNLGDPCLENADCNAPFLCENAACGFDKRAICDKDATRCNGESVETCTGDAGDAVHGNEWTVKDTATDTCKYGCRYDPEAKKAACLAAQESCVPNATRCSKDGAGVVEQCDAAGGRWRTVFACPTACEEVGGAAQCTAQVCEPFATRCKEGTADTYQTCGARGTVWTDSACGKPSLRECKACQLDTECNTGEECFKSTDTVTGGVCRKRTTCSTTADCQPSGTTGALQMECVKATPSDATGRCETRCSDDADCGSDICASTGFCQRCDTGENCAAGPGETATFCRRTCAADTDCPDGQVCPAGSGARACTPETDVCTDGRCLAIRCRAGETRCNGPAIERCSANRTQWITDRTCTNGCDYDASAHKASCAGGSATNPYGSGVCTPGTTRCNADRQTLQTCNERGTAFEESFCGPATVTTWTEPAWIKCPLGGQRAEYDSGGATSAVYRCNADSSYLAGITVETVAADPCTRGGKKVVFSGGDSANLAGSTFVFCNGASANVSVAVTPLSNGALGCASGGKRTVISRGASTLADVKVCNALQPAVVDVTDEAAGTISESSPCPYGGKRIVKQQGTGPSETLLCNTETGPNGFVNVALSDAALTDCVVGGKKAAPTRGSATLTAINFCNFVNPAAIAARIEIIDEPARDCRYGGKNVAYAGGNASTLTVPNPSRFCHNGTGASDQVVVNVSTELPNATLCPQGGKLIKITRGVSGATINEFRVCNTTTPATATVTDEIGGPCTRGGKTIVRTGGYELHGGDLVATEQRTTVCTGVESTCVAAEGRCRPRLCETKRDAAGAIVEAERQKRCVGNVLEQCNGTETAFDAVEICGFGCDPSSATPACRATPACDPGDLGCGGSDSSQLVACAPDRISYEFVRYCPAGCAVQPGTKPVVADCLPTYCSPLARRCGLETDTGRGYVEVCAATGAEYRRTEDCAQGCQQGYCSVTDANCVPGAIRCSRNEAETCVRMDNGATQWRFSELCLGGCSNGACLPGGSVGCSGGPNATIDCGVPARQAIRLSPVLKSASDVVNCDGVSRVLVHSAPIASVDGAVVPDGTMVTFTQEGGTDALLASADADASAPGLQRPTLAGVATILVAAPASCEAPRTVRVRGTVSGRATGFADLHFAAPTPCTSNAQCEAGVSCSASLCGGRPAVYVAEDFSTQRGLDRNASAELDLVRGAMVGLPAYELGTGSDGDYFVNDGAVHDLTAEGYARHWGIVRISGNQVWIDNVMPSLSTGDEVLITTVWSQSPATVGQYEFRRVAEVASGRILLTEPVRNIYGRDGANDSFVNVRAVVQRVPQFRNVTIAAFPGGQSCSSDASCDYQAFGQTCVGANPAASVQGSCTAKATSLTTSAPASGTLVGGGSGITGGGSGIVALRATGTVRLLGRIDLTGKGMPTGSVTPATNAAHRLVVGRAVSGDGAGAIYLAANTLSFLRSGGSTPVEAEAAARIASVGSSLLGSGSVILKGASFEFGTTTTRVFAGSGAKVRLDYGRFDNDPLGVPSPSVAPVSWGPAAVTWDGTTNFASGTVVSYLGNRYIAIASATNVNRKPDIEPSYWLPEPGGLDIGQGGSFVAKSLIAYDEEAIECGHPPSDALCPVNNGVRSLRLQIGTGELLGWLGGSGAVLLGQASGVQLGLPISISITADDGLTYGLATQGPVLFSPEASTTAPFLGPKFKWEAALTPVDDKPVYLRGVAFKLGLK